MNSIRLLNKAKLAFNVFQPRFYVVFSHCCNNYITSLRNVNIKLHPQNMSHRVIKYISNCNLMQTKDSDSLANSPDNKKCQKALEDEEFQNILQDFAKDFGVDNDSNKLLEDIRKNVDGNHTEKELSVKPHTRNSDAIDKRFPLKYKDFSDSDSSIIYSYEEQHEPLEENENFYHIDQDLKSKMSYQDLKRGVTGVYDLEELINVLRNESLMDITAISIPKDLHYADFLVLVTAKSARHSEAAAELILKLYKQKKNKRDPFIKVEGRNVTNWKAMDMGNIVLHIFLEETRALYDLESLWLFDSDFDSGGNAEPDPMISILEEQMEFFNSLQQSSESPPKES